MTRSIYALLVGINNYKSSIIPPLKGCVNDVTAIDDFLRKQLINNEDKLYIKKLINREATRQAIIDGFREHLCQAKSNDIALFYFSGHGSQEEAAKEFWHLEPDHLNETLVCWDSRTDGIWDLADKEIAKLIAEVYQNHPHIVVILDCCHSAGGTRSQDDVSSVEFDFPQRKYTGVRSVDTESRERPFSSFIFSPEEIRNILSTSQFHESSENQFSLPQGEYILLAACRDNEEAREHYSQERGAFSFFLINTLQRSNGSLTYRDLFKRTNALVRAFYPKQSPQIEATNSGYLAQPFLGGAIVQKQAYFTVFHNGNYGWSIDAGAVHGVLPGLGEERTRLAIFPVNIKNLSQLSQAIAVAEVVEILPQMSRINISGIREELQPDLTYKAVITNLPLSPLKVYFDGEETGIYLARQAMRKAAFDERPSLYVCEVTESTEADFYMKASGGEYLITRPGNHPQSIPRILDYTNESALQAVQYLEHIARWINIATISNPGHSHIQPEAIQLQIYHQNSELIDYPIYLKYQERNAKLKPPSIKIKLTNTSNQALYCVLLNLTELYGIKAIYFTGKRTSIRLEPGQEVWAWEGKSKLVSIPQSLWNQGITEYKDILKLIVSTTDFDATLLEQNNLETDENRSIHNFSNQKYIPLNKALKFLEKEISTRAIVAYTPEPQEPEITNDWVTSEVMISTVIPKLITLQTTQDVDMIKNNSLLDESDNYDWRRYIKFGIIAFLSLLVVFFIILNFRNNKQDKSLQKNLTSTKLILY